MIVKDLARFVGSLSDGSIPQPVQIKAKQTILDCLGNALSGRYCEEGEMIKSLADCSSPTSEASVICYGTSSLEKAAMVNAVMCRVVDLDDGHKYSNGHPSTVMVPTALAVGEYLGSSGREVVTAVVAGYEVFVRIARGIRYSAVKEKGFDMTGLAGSLAAAATAGKLMDFTEEQLTSAMGIAGSFTGGLYECLSDNSSPKLLVSGWAARTGIVAAKLVQLGFTGPASILEGRKGLAQAVTNSYDLTNVLDGLGEHFEIMGTYFKKYACMRGLHGGVDAVLEIRDQYGLRPEDIKHITIYTSNFVKQYDKPFPISHIAAQSNLPYCISVGLYNQAIGPDEMIAGLNDGRVNEMFRKITVVLDDEMERYNERHFDQMSAVKAVVETTGASYKQDLYVLSGEPEKPLSQQELEDKFVFLAGKALSAERSGLVYDRVMELDTGDDINSLMKLIGKPE